MSVILVVEQDASFAGRISETLKSGDVSIEITGGCTEALELAETLDPALLIASSAVPGVRELLAAYSRQRGGPGAVVMVPVSAASQVSAKDFDADELLSRSFTDEELKVLVDRYLGDASNRAKTPRPTAESEQLTSADIFGDVLAEVEAESQNDEPRRPSRSSSKPMDDIERKLEETLSGVIPLSTKKRASSAPRAPQDSRRAEIPTDSEIDDLLDQTLSSLDLPARGRRQAPSKPLGDEPENRDVAQDDAEVQPHDGPTLEASVATPSADTPSAARPDDAPLEPPTHDAPGAEVDEEESLPDVSAVTTPDSVTPESGPEADSPSPFVSPQSFEPLSPPEPSPDDSAPSEPRESYDASTSSPVEEEPAAPAVAAGGGDAVPDELPATAADAIAPVAEDDSAPSESTESEFSFGFGQHSEQASEDPAAAEPAPSEQPDTPERPDTMGSAIFEADGASDKPASSGVALPVTDLDDLHPADQFRTQALPTLDLIQDMPEGEAFGDYTLLDRIALGGMAEVWRARRRGVEGFQKTVAIKKILSHLTGSQDFVTMFIDEAKLAAQLNHNNIIQIYDLGKVGTDFFIAMEHVDGKDLRSILTAAQNAKRPVPLGLGLFVVSAVARALDYAHRKRDFDNRAMGLVHRDVSPQNVLISYEGEIKLCDFGIVKAVAKASTTKMGALKGKLQYMSPEQAWGKTVDARSDIFSLGSVLFEVLTGKQLFSGESEISILDAVRECRVQSVRDFVPEIPEEIDQIVSRALTKTPEERYQTAGDLEQELEEAIDRLSPTPSQKDLAAYLQELMAEPGVTESAEIPPLEKEPVETASQVFTESSPEITEPAIAKDDPKPASEPESSPSSDDRGKRRGWMWLLAAILVGILIGVGALILRTSKTAPAPNAGSPTEVERPATPTTEALPLPPSTEAAPPPADGAQPAGESGEGLAPDESQTHEDPATDPPEPTADETPGAAGIDIEQMVNDELTNRAEQLRRDFEAEKKRIEDELAKTRAEKPPPEEPVKEDESDPDEGGNGL